MFFYPIDIDVNTTVTLYKEDRSKISTTSTLKLLVYNKNKVLIDTIPINSGLTYKVATLNSVGKYLSWSEKPDKLYMCEKGINQVENNYVKYFKELQYCVRDGLKPIETNVLNLTTATENSEIKIDTSDGCFYTIKPIELYIGRKIKVYAYVNGVYKETTLKNIHTGKITNTIYQNGEYLLCNINGVNKIKVASEFGTTLSKPTCVNMVKYATLPYIANENKNTEYLPIADSYVSVQVPSGFGVYNNKVYGFTGGKIISADLDTKEITTVRNGEGTIKSAMIFDNGNIVFTRSDTYYAYLLKNGEEKQLPLYFYNTNNNIALLPNLLFSHHNYKNIGIVGEYSGNKTPISGYKAYVTKDYGETWELLFDLEKLIDDSNTRNYHLHSCVYDSFDDMYWTCSGDLTTIDMIWYSLDGITWHKSQNKISIKATEIVPMRDCVLFVSDSEATCSMKWNRIPIVDGDTLYFDVVDMIVDNWKAPCPIGSKAYYDEKKNITFFGYSVDDNIINSYAGDSPIKYGCTYVTDGFNTKEYYVPKYIGGVIGMFGNDKYIVQSRTGNCMIFKR